MQPTRGFALGRPLGSALSVHLSWLPAGALLATHLSFIAYGDQGLLAALSLGAVTLLAYFVCVLVHALAHIVVGRITGTQPSAVSVFIFGDVAVMPESTGRSRIWTALSGPIVSAVLAAAFLFASATTDASMSSLLRTIGLANAAIAALNLLPAFPLDGGQIVAAAGRRRKLTERLGRLAGAVALVAGSYLLLRDPELVAETAFGLWLALTGLFVVVRSKTATAVASPLHALDKQTAGAWARPFTGRIDGNAEAPASGGPFAVSSDGRLTGVLTQAPAIPGVKVADVMIPWSADLNVSSDTSLVRALEKLANERAPIVVVVDGEGVVRGVLDEEIVRTKMAAS